MEAIYSIFRIFIYVPILTASVMFGGYIGFLIWAKLNRDDAQYGLVVGGAVGLFFLYPTVCDLLGLG